MFPQNEETPRELIDLAEEALRGFDESGKLPDRLIRYAVAHERTLINLAHVDQKINALDNTDLFKRELKKLRPRLAECG